MFNAWKKKNKQTKPSSNGGEKRYSLEEYAVTHFPHPYRTNITHQQFLEMIEQGKIHYKHEERVSLTYMIAVFFQFPLPAVYTMRDMAGELHVLGNDKMISSFVDFYHGNKCAMDDLVITFTNQSDDIKQQILRQEIGLTVIKIPGITAEQWHDVYLQMRDLVRILLKN